MNPYDATEAAYKNGYADAVREIFADIEKVFFKYYETRVTYSDPTLLYHIREAVGFSLNEMFTEIAELKKKYTEEIYETKDSHESL